MNNSNNNCQQHYSSHIISSFLSLLNVLDIIKIFLRLCQRLKIIKNNFKNILILAIVSLFLLLDNSYASNGTSYINQRGNKMKSLDILNSPIINIDMD